MEVTILLSNLIKSGFITFSQDKTLIVDANKNKIIQGIDAQIEEENTLTEISDEETLAEALIEEAMLDGMDDGDLLTMDTANLSNLIPKENERLGQIAEDVIKSAKEEADDIINRAHDEAEQLRASAYEEAEQIKQSAKEEGYQDGYNKATTQAEAELNAKRKELAEKEQQLNQQLQEQKEALLYDTEHKMVDWLCKMIPSITGVVIENQKDVLLHMINNALHELDNSKHFIIKVSSEDYEGLLERKEEIYGARNPSIELELFEDAKLSPMQCLIDTDNGIVDVSLDVQLDNLNRALKLLIKE